MKLTSIESTIYTLHEVDGLNFSDIARIVGLSSGSAVKEKFNKVKRSKETEESDPIARLNIDYSTYHKLVKARRHVGENNKDKECIDLTTIEGLITAVNDRFKTYNSGLYFDTITPRTINKIMIALKEAGYKLDNDILDIGLSLSSDLICVRSERYIEFDIKDTSGIFKCESDGTNCQLFFAKQTKYPKDEIQRQILDLIRKEGYLI